MTELVERLREMEQEIASLTGVPRHMFFVQPDDRFSRMTNQMAEANVEMTKRMIDAALSPTDTPPTDKTHSD